MSSIKKQLYENRKIVEKFQKIAGLLEESYASHNPEEAEKSKFEDILYIVGQKLSVDEDKAWNIVHDMIYDDINGDKMAKKLFSHMSITAEEVADYIVNKVGKNDMSK